MRVFSTKLSSGPGGCRKINTTKRINYLLERAEEAGAAGATVFGQSSIYYFTGAMSGGVFAAGNFEPVLFAPSVNYEEAKNSAKFSGEVESFSGSLPYNRIFKKFKEKKILCDSSEISHSLALKMDEKNPGKTIFKPGCLNKIRMIKDKEEIGLIENACRRTTEIVESININEWIGREEASLAGYIQKCSWEKGFGGPAFNPVVAAGLNSSFPHHTPGRGKINTGAVKIDCGVKFSEYSSDLTRTFILNRLNKTQFFRSILDKVREAKRKAEKVLRPGTKCSDVYHAAAGIFEKYGLKKYFIHNLGHGLGIDIHENPSLSPANQEELRVGMVVTVEPGLYIPSKGGVRLEDTYLITVEGSRKLTRKYP